jgi:hypothetical protein
MYCQLLSKQIQMESFKENGDNSYHIRDIFFNSGMVVYEV